MLKPHGGKLVNRVVAKEKREAVREKAQKLTPIPVSSELLQEIANIAYGVYSPLEGFLGEEDYISVLDNRRLANGLPWTIPILLDVEEELAKKLINQDAACLTDPRGNPVAIIFIEDIYGFHKEELALKVFGTTSLDHPGVAKVKKMKDRLVGGKIALFKEPRRPFSQYALTPFETRVLFKEKGWDYVVGFQTRNVPHLGHEYVQKTALSFTDGLFINPVIGPKKPGDFRDELIIQTYEILIEKYHLKERVVLATLNMPMRYAGPREAIFHAIIRKNFGCTHFIIGRDHAGVGNFYNPFAAHQIFDEFPDLEIVPLFFRSFFYCTGCRGVVNEKICPHEESRRVDFSGTKIRELLANGKIPPSRLMRPEVAQLIVKHKNPFVE